jgi:UDP-N-acetylmuramoyl-L-alanyl-D-glutamate--2,6-diaminopimelate ligase
VLRTADPRALLSTLAARLYRYPQKALTLSGVTGTNGKTTVVYMLNKILTDAGHASAFWSTNAVDAGHQPFRPTMTTPDPPDLYAFLDQARRHRKTQVVLEVSSHALALGRIAGLRFQTGAITNVTPDHLDFHGDFAAYVKTKQQFCAYVMDTVWLNRDDPVVRSFEGSSAAIRWFGLSAGCEVRASSRGLVGRHARWRIEIGGHAAADLELAVPGQHNVCNALAAIAMATTLGIAPADAVCALSDFVPPPRRLQQCHLNPITVISDVAMNRASYDAVFTTLSGMPQPVVVVTALRGNRGLAVNQDIADVLADWHHQCHFKALIATESRDELAGLSVDHRVRPEERDAFMTQAAVRQLPVSLCINLSDALDQALSPVASGGTLLLLGTFGMDRGLELVRQKLGAD